MINDGYLTSRRAKPRNWKNKINFSRHNSTFETEPFYKNAPISQRWRTTKPKHDGKLLQKPSKRNQRNNEISTMRQPTKCRLTSFLEPYKIKSYMKSTKCSILRSNVRTPQKLLSSSSRKVSAPNNATKDTAIRRLQEFLRNAENSALNHKTKIPTKKRLVEIKNVRSKEKLETKASENTLKNTFSSTYTLRPPSVKGTTVTYRRKRRHLDASESKNVCDNRLLSGGLSRHKQPVDERMQEHSKYIDRNLHKLQVRIRRISRELELVKEDLKNLQHEKNTLAANYKTK